MSHNAWRTIYVITITLLIAPLHCFYPVESRQLVPIGIIISREGIAWDADFITDDEIVVAGELYDIGRLFVAKINLSGKLEWFKIVLVNLVDVNRNPLAVTPDGNLILFVNGASLNSKIVLKLGDDGEIIWSKSIIFNNIPYVRFDSVEVSPNGDIFIAGLAEYNNDYYVVVIKLDPYGNPCWSTLFKDDNARVYLSGFVDMTLVNNNIVVVGELNGGSFIAMLNSDGDILWYKFLPIWAPIRVVSSNDTIYVLLNLLSEFIVIALDSDGNIKWASKIFGKQIYHNSSHFRRAEISGFDIAISQTGYIVVVGSYWLYSRDSTWSFFDSGSIVLLNSNGRPMWIKVVDLGITIFDTLFAVSISSKGRIAVVGRIHPNVTVMWGFTDYADPTLIGYEDYTNKLGIKDSVVLKNVASIVSRNINVDVEDLDVDTQVIYGINVLDTSIETLKTTTNYIERKGVEIVVLGGVATGLAIQFILTLVVIIMIVALLLLLHLVIKTRITLRFLKAVFKTKSDMLRTCT